MSFISNLFIWKKATETDILNCGLKYAMAFGKDWLQPIQQRLACKYNYLSATQLDYYDEICRTAMNIGQKYVYDILNNLNIDKLTITEDELKGKLRNFLIDKYPWIDNRNIMRMYSQAAIILGKTV